MNDRKLTLLDSLPESQKQTYRHNYSLTAKIISRLQKYQVNDEILDRTPREIIDEVIENEQNEALNEIHKQA